MRKMVSAEDVKHVSLDVKRKKVDAGAVYNMKNAKTEKYEEVRI